MARPKGTRNKNVNGTPGTLKLSHEARLAFLANLIVDRIEQDKKDGFAILKKLEEK